MTTSARASTGRRLIVGIGARAGVRKEELDQAIDLALAAVSRHRDQVAVLATLDRKAADPEILTLARENGWELRAFTAGELARVPVPRPSATVRAETGTPSVAEAAARRAGGELIAAKRVFPRVTVAISERVPA
jgi:cobalamin biosynthesis protein CbiG